MFSIFTIKTPWPLNREHTNTCTLTVTCYILHMPPMCTVGSRITSTVTRKGKSTVDALFCLLNLVQKYLNENERLYCVFVDLKMAYDCIHRNAMWLKLYKLRINGYILRIVKDMYEKVNSCVRS